MKQRDIWQKDFSIIQKIAERYEDMMNRDDRVAESRWMTVLDLEHMEDLYPESDLNTLLLFDEADFAHDMFGIKRHFNRRTLEMEDCFLPRFVQ